MKRISTSPLTGRILSGRVNKAGTEFVGDTDDVTGEVMKAVIEKAEFHGGTFQINRSDGESWEVTVTKKPRRISSPDGLKNLAEEVREVTQRQLAYFDKMMAEKNQKG